MSCHRLLLAFAAAVLLVVSGCTKRGLENADDPADAVIAEAAKVTEGSVLQALDSKRVYLVVKGNRRYIPSHATLQALGLANQVTTIADSVLDAVPMGERMPELDSPVIQKASTGQIFALEAGKRRYIPNPQTFDALHFTKEQVRAVSDAVADSIPLGEPERSAAK